MRNDDLDPIEVTVRNVLAPDRATARRLATAALAPSKPQRSRRLVPIYATFVLLVAVAVGVLRYSAPEPSIVIRGEAGAIVIERGSGKNKTIEIVRDQPQTGGVVVIREGGD